MVTVNHDLCRVADSWSQIPPSQSLLRSVAVVGGGGPAGGREAGTEGSVSLPSPRPAGCHLPSPPTRRAEDAWSTGRERRGAATAGLAVCWVGVWWGGGRSNKDQLFAVSPLLPTTTQVSCSLLLLITVRMYNDVHDLTIDKVSSTYKYIIVNECDIVSYWGGSMAAPRPQTAKYHQHLTTITTVVFPG